MTVEVRKPRAADRATPRSVVLVVAPLREPPAAVDNDIDRCGHRLVVHYDVHNILVVYVDFDPDVNPGAQIHRH
jgi:hypothetical protein